MRNLILNRLPWSLKGFFGGRPQGTISIHSLKNRLAFSGSTLLMPKPITLEGSYNQNFTENFCFPSPPLLACELKNGRVFRNNNLFSVITDSKKLVIELSSDPLKRELHPIFTEAYLPAPIRLKGRTLMLATLGADLVYYHWIIDLLPKIVIAEQAGYPINTIDHFLVNPISFSSQRESLENMGIPLDRLVFLTEGQHYCSDELIVPTEVLHNPAPNKFIKRKLLKTSLVNPKRRIFISRGKAPWRNVVNKEDLLNVLKKYDFEIIENEDLSFEQQIRLFNESQVVISTHGANLTNIFFCTPDTRIIELIADWHHNVDYWLVASNNQLKYYHVGSQSVPSHEVLNYQITQNYNLNIDIVQLEWMIEKAINLS
jgi:hypothetical protein